MKPQEKAQEIVLSYEKLPTLIEMGGLKKRHAKECAKIHVSGIINILSIDFTSLQKEKLLFWNEVLREINNL